MAEKLVEQKEGYADDRKLEYWGSCPQHPAVESFYTTEHSITLAKSGWLLKEVCLSQRIV